LPFGRLAGNGKTSNPAAKSLSTKAKVSKGKREMRQGHIAKSERYADQPSRIAGPWKKAINMRLKARLGGEEKAREGRENVQQ